MFLASKIRAFSIYPKRLFPDRSSKAHLEISMVAKTFSKSTAYPIMQHAEMSFLDSPPKKLFFYCKKAPKKFGETPITESLNVLLKETERDLANAVVLFQKKNVPNRF